jgi:hypothetical protein
MSEHDAPEDGTSLFPDVTDDAQFAPAITAASWGACACRAGFDIQRNPFEDVGPQRGMRLAWRQGWLEAPVWAEEFARPEGEV